MLAAGASGRECVEMDVFEGNGYVAGTRCNQDSDRNGTSLHSAALLVWRNPLKAMSASLTGEECGRTLPLGRQNDGPRQLADEG